MSEQVVVKENGVFNYFFPYTDHLGSILTVTDKDGLVIAEQNFDAWGRKRNVDTWDYDDVNEVPTWLYRGFTGHKHLPEFGLINMNARLYDPVLGRMLSVDNYVGAGTQGFNRYSYARNNPLRFIDPDGNDPVGFDFNAFNASMQQTMSSIMANANSTASSIAINNQVSFNFSANSSSFVGTKPTPLAGMIGDRYYYQARMEDFIQRNPGLTPPDYYMGYGDKYVERFRNETFSRLSPEGQVWLGKTLTNLQRYMEKGVLSNSDIELDNSAFQDFAFDTHVNAYVDAGLLELSIMDKVNVGLTPDAKDIFSDRGVRQAVAVGKLQALFYLNNPNFAYAQGMEAYSNRSQIMGMISDYVISPRNQSFFSAMKYPTGPGGYNPTYGESALFRLLKSASGFTYIF